MTAAAWNLLVYTVAGNDGEHDNATHAVTEMHRALSTQQCNIVVQLHAKTKTTRYWISHQKGLRVEELLYIVDASKPASLTSFIDVANENFPARSSALVMWAHSSGRDYARTAEQPAARQAVFDDQAGAAAGVGVSVIGGEPAATPAPWLAPSGRGRRSSAGADDHGRSWGPDPHSNLFLTHVEMRQAIAASKRSRVDVLCLNACSLGSLEVAYELRDVADVQVASQVDASPWSYGAIVAALAADPEQSAVRLARAIVESVKARFAPPKIRDAASALRSDKLGAVDHALQDLANHLIALAHGSSDSVSKAMAAAPYLDDPFQIDLISLIRALERLDPRLELEAKIIASKFRTALVANVAHESHPGAHGLSIYCPRITVADVTAIYRGTDFEHHAWVQFLQVFQAKLATE